MAVATPSLWPEPMAVLADERRVLMPLPRPDILAFSRAHYILSPKTSKISGPWSDAYTPYVRRPLTLLQTPPVRVWVSACRQSGKSTLGGALTNYILEADPGPTGLVLPQEGTARDRVRTKLRPLFENSPSLLAKIGGDIRNLNVGEPTDLSDMILYLCWASSIITLSDRSIQNMIYDEAALMTLTNTGENPVEAGRDRQTTYAAIARELGVSSAGDEGDLHDRQMREGSDEVWYVPCLVKGCGRWHAIRTEVDEADEKYLVVDRPSPGAYYYYKEYLRNPRRVRYVCPHCGKAWSESQRQRSNLEGVYVSHHRPQRADGTLGDPAQAMDAAGSITGPAPTGPDYSFTWNAMMVYPEFLPMCKIAAFFVEARAAKDRGNTSLLKKWTRSYQATGWKEVARAVESSRIYQKKNQYPAGVVPNDVRVLVAGADFHKSELGRVRVDYLVKGFGEDLRNYDILFGHADSLEEMFRVTTALSFPWAEPTDKPELMLSCGFIDSAYQPDDEENNMIDEVYQFCRKYWGMLIWYPIRGGKPTQVEMFQTKPLDRVVADRRDNKSKRRRGNKSKRRHAGKYCGMELLTLAVVQFKNLVAAWAEAPLGAAASTSYNRDMPPEFFYGLTNEAYGKNEDGKWGWWPREGRKASNSHTLDISGYATAAGYLKGVNELWSEAELNRIEAARAGRGLGRKVRLSEKPRRRR
jgi:phage terminase large subunit GpA-like protein